MSKRCPPGIICFENITIVIIIVLLCSILLFIHYKNSNATTRPNMHMQMPNMQMNNMPMSNMQMPNMPMSNTIGPPDMYPGDVLNQFAPRRSLVMPINVPTQPFDPNYRQVGILTRIKGKETILPLMGRPVLSNRDKWNFYTTNDKSNVITLPITFKGRSCASEYGCDNLNSGDVVFVDGYNDAFRVTAYDNQVMRYIPFI